MAESPDHRDGLGDVDVAEQRREFAAIDLGTADPEGLDPGLLDEFEGVLAGMLADYLSEDAAQQANVLA